MRLNLNLQSHRDLRIFHIRDPEIEFDARSTSFDFRSFLIVQLRRRTKSRNSNCMHSIIGLLTARYEARDENSIQSPHSRLNMARRFTDGATRRLHIRAL
eukprot:1195848-Prorocentrum_minimum.AAC.5